MRGLKYIYSSTFSSFNSITFQVLTFLLFYGIILRLLTEISNLGHVKAKKVSSGNTYNYLMVYDGWRDYPVYINYSTVDFMDCDAACFTIKK